MFPRLLKISEKYDLLIKFHNIIRKQDNIFLAVLPPLTSCSCLYSINIDKVKNGLTSSYLMALIKPCSASHSLQAAGMAKLDPPSLEIQGEPCIKTFLCFVSQVVPNIPQLSKELSHWMSSETKELPVYHALELAFVSFSLDESVFSVLTSRFPQIGF